MSQHILSEIAQRLDVSESELGPVLETVIQRIQQQVAHYGYARLAGLGTFRGREGELTFEPDSILTETANLPYAGLAPLKLGRPRGEEDVAETDADVVAGAGAATWSGEQLPTEHTLAEFEDDEERDEAGAIEDEDAFDLKKEPWDDTAEDTDDESGGEPSDEWEDDWEDDTEEHPLGPLPAEEFEDADYSVVEDDASEEPLPELQFQDDQDDVDTQDDIEAAAPSAAADESAESDERPEVPDALDEHPPPTPAEPTRMAETPEAETPEPDELSDAVEPIGAAEAANAADELEPAEPDEPSEAYEPGDANAPTDDSREPDRRARPHESIRRGWPSERAGHNGLDGATSRRNTILIGAGLLIIIAAAAVGYLAMQPAEPTGTEIVSEAEEPQPTPPGDAETEDAQADDESADDAASPDATDEVEEGTEPPASPASTPLRSPDGIDTAAGGFTIVVYSETSEASAGQVAQEYGDEGFRSGVISSQNGVTRYRVGVGQFETLEEATEARNQLAGSELPDDAWVHRLQ